MLVLSRKVNESICIDGDVWVTVIEIRGDKCRLGINAPLEKSVHRSEVQARIERKNVVPDGCDNGGPL